MIRTIWKMNTQLMTLIAIGSAYMGYEWMSVGWGINPMIAFPIATLAVIIPHMKGWR